MYGVHIVFYYVLQDNINFCKFASEKLLKLKRYDSQQRRIQDLGDALRRQHRWQHQIGRSEGDARKDGFRYG
jgi:hypothetical protein